MKRHPPPHNPKALRSETTLMPWIIWFLAVLFYAYEFTQRVSISIYLPYLLKDLATNTAAIGMMSSLFYWAYAFMQIPSGVLIDKLGAKKLASAGIILVSLGALCFSMIHSVTAGTLARLLIGVGSSVAFISAMQLIIIWFPPYRFALLAGLTNLIGYIGATIGEVPLNTVVAHFGWREASLGSAVVGFFLSILIVLYVRDKPYKGHKIKKKPARMPTPSIFKGLKKILTRSMNWQNGIYTMLMMGPTSAFAALWGKTFLMHADHLSAGNAAGAVSAIFIGVAVGSPIFGWLSEYFERRQPLLVLAAIGAMCTTIFLIFLNHENIALIYIVCFLFGFFQSAHVLNFAIAKTINMKKNSGAAMGFTNMAAILGGAWLQPMIGIIIHWKTSPLLTATAFSLSSYHTALVLIPLCQLVAFLIAIFCLSDQKQAQIAKKIRQKEATA